MLFSNSQPRQAHGGLYNAVQKGDLGCECWGQPALVSSAGAAFLLPPLPPTPWLGKTLVDLNVELWKSGGETGLGRDETAVSGQVL